MSHLRDDIGGHLGEKISESTFDKTQPHYQPSLSVDVVTSDQEKVGDYYPHNNHHEGTEYFNELALVRRQLSSSSLVQVDNTNIANSISDALQVVSETYQGCSTPQPISLLSPDNYDFPLKDGELLNISARPPSRLPYIQKDSQNNFGNRASISTAVPRDLNRNYSSDNHLYKRPPTISYNSSYNRHKNVSASPNHSLSLDLRTYRVPPSQNSPNSRNNQPTPYSHYSGNYHYNQRPASPHTSNFHLRAAKDSSPENHSLNIERQPAGFPDNYSVHVNKQPAMSPTNSQINIHSQHPAIPYNYDDRTIHSPLSSHATLNYHNKHHFQIIRSPTASPSKKIPRKNITAFQEGHSEDLTRTRQNMYSGSSEIKIGNFSIPFEMSLHQIPLFNDISGCFKGKNAYAAYIEDVKDNNFKGPNRKFTRYALDIAAIAIEKEFEKGHYDFVKENFLEIKEQLMKIFPKEDGDNWYIPSSGRHSRSQGWLYCAYITARDNATHVGYFAKRAPRQEELPTPVTISLPEGRDGIDDNILHDWREKDTVIKRKKLFKTLTINEIFEKFLPLRCSNGFLLIKDDFERTHKLKSEQLINNWPLLSDKIIEKALQLEKDEDIKKCLDNNKELLQNSSETDSEKIALIKEGKIVFGFILLSYLISPSKKPAIQSTKKETAKITKSDTCDTFIYQEKDLDNLEQEGTYEAIYEKVKLLYQKTLSPDVIAPFIIICGKSLTEIKSYYAAITPKFKYKLPNVIAAIDICVHAKIVFCGNYGLINRHVWQFVEYYGCNTGMQHPYNVVTKFYKTLNL